MTQHASDVHLVDFNALPLSARERLAACLHGREEPVPLLAELSRVGIRVFTLVATLLGAVALLALLVMVGLGRVGSEDAVQGPGWLFFYWLSAFIFLGAGFAYVHGSMVRSRLPYPPGRYLLPFDVVDASSPRLRIRPLTGLTDVKALHHQTSGAYSHSMLTLQFEDGTSEALKVEGRVRADAILARFWEVQHDIREAAAQEDWDTFAALDPLYEARWLEGGFGALPAAGAPAEPPFARRAPFLARHPVLVGAAAALLVAPMLWGVRNVVGDVMLRDAAVKADVKEAYQHYLREGFLNKESMQAALPRVAFRQAKRKGTVTALREVLKQFAGSSVEPEARAEVHALFKRNLERFRREAAASDPVMLAFMERLLAHLESTDNPIVPVRFRSPGPVALAEMDRSLSRRAHAMGGRSVAPIAPHFDLKSAHGREERIVKELHKGFARVFPADMMVLKAAPRVEGAAAPGAGTAGFQIDYDVAPSGAFYFSEGKGPAFLDIKTGRGFVGIKIGFDVTLAAPGGPPLAFKLAVAPPQRFTVASDSVFTDPSDERVYRIMAERAFEQLSTKFGATFFRPAGPAPAAPRR